MKAVRYVRFVVADLNPGTSHRLGLFNGVDAVRRRFSVEQATRWDGSYEWFRQNLPAPDRLTRSRYPRAQDVALSWFKDTATECIARMRVMELMLNEHDVVTAMLRTERPGYLVYEDEWQIAAEPFADAPT